MWAISILRRRVRYLLKWNSFSSSSVWYRVYVCLPRFRFDPETNKYFNIVFTMVLKRQLSANRVDPDQTPHSAASDQGLHCLPPICILRHLIRVYTVCHPPNSLWPLNTVKWTCSDFRTSKIRSWNIQLFTVNTFHCLSCSFTDQSTLIRSYQTMAVLSFEVW